MTEQRTIITATAVGIAERSVALLDAWIATQTPCARAALIATRETAIRKLCAQATAIAVLVHAPDDGSRH